MALLNTPTPFPAPIWVTARFLAAEPHPVPEARIFGYLEPASVGGAERSSSLVRHSLNTLRDLGLAARDANDERWSLCAGLKELVPDNYRLFQRRLHDAVFGIHDGEDLGAAPDTAQDLRRALCWFMTKDPYTEAFNWSIAEQAQAADSPDGELILVNSTRWPSFTAWGSAMGLLAAAPHVAEQYVPDCTQAVRQVVEDHWEVDATLDARSVLRLLRSHLPGLPGGLTAESIGFKHAPEHGAGPALSFALLRGEFEGWLRLSSDADAQNIVTLSAPAFTSPRTCSSITRLEPVDD